MFNVRDKNKKQKTNKSNKSFLFFYALEYKKVTELHKIVTNAKYIRYENTFGFHNGSLY